MMRDDVLYGGLVFSTRPGQALNRFCHITAAALKHRGHAVARISVLSDRQARVTSEAALVVLSLEPFSPNDRPYGLTTRMARGRPHYRLQVTLSPARCAGGETEAQKRLLLTLLFNMCRATNAGFVEWLDPQTQIPAMRFLETMREAAPDDLTPGLMPDSGPLFLTAAYRPAPADKHPDITLSRDLRDVLQESARPAAQQSRPRPTFAARIANAIPKLDLPVVGLSRAA